MKKPKKWDVSKEEQLVASIIQTNNLCHELGLPELVPTEAARVILDKSREHVEELRALSLRTMSAVTKLVQ